MPMGSIADTIAGCMSMQLERMGICGGVTEATFTLYRKDLLHPAAPIVDQRSDLGIQRRTVEQNFEPVATNVPCIFAGTNRKSDRAQVTPEGQHQDEMITLITTYQDIREWDNLVLSFDGKTYCVEASSPVGPLMQCYCSTGEAQL